jgi:hypothetical protein
MLSSPCVLSRSKRRQRLRHSPLLQPLTHTTSRSIYSPFPPPPKPRCNVRLSKKKRQVWMKEALASLDQSTISLQLQHELLHSPQHQRSIDTAMINTAPELPTISERVMETLAQATQEQILTTTRSPNRGPYSSTTYLQVKPYIRGLGHKPIVKPMVISALVSQEVRTTDLFIVILNAPSHSTICVLFRR